MAHLLSHHKIDKAAWDACIEASPQKQVYALSWYLDVVSPGWCAVVEETQGRYVAVLPLPINNKFGISYIRQPLFCQQLGMFALEEFGNEAQTEELLQVVQKHFRYTSGYSFNTANTAMVGLLAESRSMEPLYTHYLPLNQPYESIKKNYTRDRKLNLKRAQQANLRIVEQEDVEPMISFFKEHVAHKIYGGVAEEAYILLRQLFERLYAKGIAKLWYTATAEGDLTAGALFVFYGNHITYLFNAANAAGRAGNGRTLLLDELIRQYAGSDFILDFESPSKEQIAFFYSSFGSEPTPFYQWKFNNLPLPIKKLRDLRINLIRNVRGKR